MGKELNEFNACLHSLPIKQNHIPLLFVLDSFFAAVLSLKVKFPVKNVFFLLIVTLVERLLILKIKNEREGNGYYAFLRIY